MAALCVTLLQILPMILSHISCNHLSIGMQQKALHVLLLGSAAWELTLFLSTAGG